MKRILFAAVLLTAIAGTAAFTRANAQQATQQMDDKILFASRLNEIDAFLGRSRVDDARRVFNDMSAIMQKFISESKNTKASTLYTETKILSADMAKNRTELVAKLREFLALMQ